MTVKPAAPLFVLLACLGALLVLPGCNRKEPPKYALITFHVETDSKMPSGMVQRLNLPGSGRTVVVKRSPEFTSLHIAGLDVRGEGRNQHLVLGLTSLGAQRLYTASASNRGKYLFLVADGVPMAYRKLDRVLNEGVLPLWLAGPEEQYETLAADLRQSIVRANEIAESN
jgi:hypothetical protein